MVEKQDKKMGRRGALQTLGALGGGLLIGAAAGWFGKPQEVLERTIERTITETITRRETISQTDTTSLSVANIENWYRKAAEPWKGVTLRCLYRLPDPGAAFIKDVLMPEFTTITGINIDPDVTSIEGAQQKIQLDLQQKTGLYDFHYDEQDNCGSWMRTNWVVDMKDFMDKHPELVDPWLDLPDILAMPSVRDTNGVWWPKDHFGLMPWEAQIKGLIYRADLFEDPTEMANFKKKYGWDLRPAVTYDEYEQIAEFFTRPPKLYGHASFAKTGPNITWDFVYGYFQQHGVADEGLPYGDPVGSYGINFDNWRATLANGGKLNSPQAVKAIEDYIRFADKYGAPDVKTWAWTEATEAFAAGLVTQIDLYSQALAFFNDPKSSKVAGKVKIALPPHDKNFWKPTMSLDYLDISGASIPVASKHPEAAWLFAQFVNSKRHDVRRAKAVVGTSRWSTIMNPEVYAAAGPLQSYYDIYRDPDKMKYFVGTDIALGDINALWDAYYPPLAKAIQGTATPQEAADELAQTIDKLLKDYGYPQK